MLTALLIILIILLILLFLYLLSSLILVFLVHKKLFLCRGQDPDNPCYLRFEDYPELEREEYRTGYYGEAIKGYFYRLHDKKGEKGLVILSHGFFGTHVQYMADIFYLCEKGYEVLAYDQYGVGISEGKNQVSLSNGIYVLENVIADVKKRNLVKGRPLLLYGHSWGAYCSLGALRRVSGIDRVVLRSGFLSPNREILSLLKIEHRFLSYYLAPIYPLCVLLLFGKRNCVTLHPKHRKDKNTKILVIHAKDDTMVSFPLSIASYFIKHPEQNVNVQVTEHGQHNSLISSEGLQNYSHLIEAYQKILSEQGEDLVKRKKEFERNLNRREAYPYNEEAKKIIDDFLNI